MARLVKRQAGRLLRLAAPDPGGARAGFCLISRLVSAGAGHPGSGVAGQAEHAEAGQVGRSGEQSEVGLLTGLPGDTPLS